MSEGEQNGPWWWGITAHVLDASRHKAIAGGLRGGILGVLGFF